MKRTKQQIACDGIKAEWYTDTFTEILHRQVSTQFSMDGVIPTAMPKQSHAVRPSEVKQAWKEEEVRRPLGKFIGGVMDGIRAPWKRAYKAA